MLTWKSIARTSFTASHAIAWSLLSATVALGQDGGGSGDKSGWVLGYAMVILAIVLGLTAVCRPGNRSSEVKRREE